ncbi:hypothetical protein DPMN_083649 [Dreissena polymorpha]|uniref:Uncharacterized protein n=1 Tax=Dreissena polymorpha TaxID=45954 RepID=A0A9D3YDA5_DREPO|nr:hypothetical protein DPMN_083649 [Dreissena polymorpha]
MTLGCLFSPFLFLLAKHSAKKTLWTQLDDYDFADNQAFHSHTQEQIQGTTNIDEDYSGKSKMFERNASNNTPITLQGKALEEVDSLI